MIKVIKHYNTLTFNIKYTKYFNFKDGVETMKMMENIISNNPNLETKIFEKILNDLVKETKKDNEKYGRASIKQLMKTKQFTYFIVIPTTTTH